MNLSTFLGSGGGAAPPPKNVERGIYEYVDREKVLYFLH